MGGVGFTRGGEGAFTIGGDFTNGGEGGDFTIGGVGFTGGDWYGGVFTNGGEGGDFTIGGVGFTRGGEGAFTIGGDW